MASDPPSTAPVAPAGSETPRPATPRRSFWQIGLRTFLLLIAAIAVWVTHANNVREIRFLKSRIESSRSMTRELIIDDPRKIAVVKLDELWYDENKWSVYLPPGEYQLCIATRDVDEDGFPPAFQKASLPPGSHQLELETVRMGEQWRTIVRVNDEIRLQVDESKEWNENFGSTGGGEGAISKQFDPEKNVVLFRRRFSKPTGKKQYQTPVGPVDGLILWIEPVAREKDQPSAAKQ